MKSTSIFGWFSTIVASLAAGCGPASSGPGQRQTSRPTPGVSKDLGRSKPDATDARKLRYYLIPRLVRGKTTAQPGPLQAQGSDLLTLDPNLGLTIEPILAIPGETRKPTDAEFAAIQALGRPIGTLYHENLKRLLTKADIRAIGQGAEAGALRFLDVTTDRVGIASLILLPEFWTAATNGLGRQIWIAIPDRRHFRVLPAGPFLMTLKMAPDFERWHRDGSSPLAAELLVREGGRITAGPSFARLAHR